MSRQISLIRGIALLTTISLASCNSYRPPLVERPRLPAPPVGFGKPVDLPPVKKGESVKVFALKNRAAAIEANRRLENDATFYDDVLALFGQ